MLSFLPMRKLRKSARRSRLVSSRLTDDEYAALKSRADSLGRTPSEHLRLRALLHFHVEGVR